MTAIRLYVSVRLAVKSFTRMAPDMAPSAAQLRAGPSGHAVQRLTAPRSVRPKCSILGPLPLEPGLSS